MRTGALKQLAQSRFGQQFLARAVAHDPPVAHENDALDLRQNIAQVMRHQHQSRSLARQPAQRLAQFALRGQVERVRGLVEQQLSAAGAPAPAQSGCAAFRRPTWCPPVVRQDASLPCAPAPPRRARASPRSHADWATASMPKRIPQSRHRARWSPRCARRAVRRPWCRRPPRQNACATRSGPSARGRRCAPAFPAGRWDRSGRSWPGSASICRSRSAPESPRARRRGCSGSRRAAPRGRRAPHSPGAAQETRVPAAQIRGFSFSISSSSSSQGWIGLRCLGRAWATGPHDSRAGARRYLPARLNGLTQYCHDD